MEGTRAVLASVVIGSDVEVVSRLISLEGTVAMGASIAGDISAETDRGGVKSVTDTDRGGRVM